MKNHKWIILFSFFVGSMLWIEDNVAQDSTLTVTLLTCDPGDNIDMLFGHSAIRVKDRQNDFVFNYGTFDFNTPGFVLKFMRGKLPYRLSVSSYNRFLNNYHAEQRGVREQELNLNLDQKRAVVEFLKWNALPENAEYKYDFFFDNCSTRIRDLLENLLKPVQFPSYQSEVTYRELLHEYLVGSPWTKFGIDLIVASKADKVADVQGQMFLPDYLHDHIANTMVQGRPLAPKSYPVLLFEDEKLRRNSAGFITPSAVFISLIFLWAIMLLSGKHNWIRVFNKFALVIVLVACILIILLWFFTDHQTTKANYNLLWLSPLSIAAFMKSRGKMSVLLAMIALTILSMIGMVSGIIPQSLPNIWAAFFVLIVLMSELLILRKDNGLIA